MTEKKEKNPKKEIKERRYNCLIHKKFQFKYVFLLVTMVLLVSAVMWILLYFTTYILSPSLELRNAELTGGLWTTGIFLLLNLCVVAIAGIAFSHRIAGPLYRVEQCIKEFIQGDSPETMKFRKGDLLNGFAAGFNKMIDVLKKKNEMIDAVLKKNNSLLEKVKTGTLSNNELKDTLTEINKAADEFKKFDFNKKQV